MGRPRGRGDGGHAGACFDLPIGRQRAVAFLKKKMKPLTIRQGR